MVSKIMQVISGVAIFFVILCGVCIVGYSETHYTRNAVVLDVTGSRVLALDLSGNVWEFIGDNFKDGQEVVMTMHTNCTDNIIADDRVINVKVIR